MRKLGIGKKNKKLHIDKRTWPRTQKLVNTSKCLIPYEEVLCRMLIFKLNSIL
jgi:hypothetical protein